MHQLKLIQLLKTLTKEEYLRFGKFLRSPFFNYTPSLVLFYEALKRHHPNFDSPRLKTEKLWAKAFPDKKYEAQKFRQLCSDLARMVEKYLVQLEMERKEGAVDNLLIEALGRRNAYPLFKKETQKRESYLEKQPYKDVDYFLEMANLEYNYYAHPLTDKYAIDPKLLDGIMDHLDGYYFSMKLKFGSELKMREKYLREEHSILFFNKIIEQSEKTYFKYNSMIQIYMLIGKLYIEEDSEKLFEKSKKLFQQNIENIKPREKTDVFLHLLNYCTGKINTGEVDYINTALGLYKIGLRHNLTMENNQLPENIYLNIVTFGCHEKEFQWTSEFIYEYEQYLEKSVQKDTKTLSLVILHFWKRDYETVIDLITNHKFSLLLHELNARTYLLRAWFEKFILDDRLLEFILTKIKAFGQYVRRNKKISNNRKEGYLGFSKTMNQFVLLNNNRLNNSKEEWSRFKENIEKQNKLIAKKWFLDKLKQ